MDIIRYKAGDVIAQAETAIFKYLVIGEGRVKAGFSDFEMTLKKGDVIGVINMLSRIHSFTYVALTDVTLMSYPIKSMEELFAFLKGKKDALHLFAHSELTILCAVYKYYYTKKAVADNNYKLVGELIALYRKLCEEYDVSPKALPSADEFEPFSPEETVDDYAALYYDALRTLDKSSLEAVFNKPAIVEYVMYKASRDISTLLAAFDPLYDYLEDVSRLVLNEKKNDISDLFLTLYFAVRIKKKDTAELENIIRELRVKVENLEGISAEALNDRVDAFMDEINRKPKSGSEENSEPAVSVAEVEDALETILQFGMVDEPVRESMRALVKQYKELPDKNETGDDSRKLRNAVSKTFYSIYEDVFFAAVQTSDDIPPAVKLFLNFGFVDMELAGKDNTCYLLSIVDSLADYTQKGVYTFYEWAKSIYSGERSPSRNEFDLDYEASLREKRVRREITVAEERELLASKEEKAVFEIRNLFQTVNKITFGRVTTFCPLFSEHNLISTLESTLCTADRLSEVIDSIRAIDFSCFYRDKVYSNEMIGIPRDEIPTEVLPEFVLMPNIGLRGSMWQEIEGSKRDTPARMMLPVFCAEDISYLVTRMCGEFRWEMCKRIQGARWNDLSELSLTSEYCDYVQFYKKNHDLSSDTKEKIKAQLAKCKNSYKEMFISDYQTWLTHESQGSPHLNKTARALLFTYCPLSKDKREELSAHPLYHDLIERYGIKLTQKLHVMNNIVNRIEKNGFPVPEEIENKIAYLKM